MTDPKRNDDRETLPAGSRTGPVPAPGRDARPISVGAREFFEHVPVGLYRTTPDGQLIDANPELARQLGYPSVDELLPVNLRELYCDAGARDEWQRRARGEGGVKDFDARMRRLDGSAVWLRDSTRAVRAEDGAIASFEGATMDVSALHHAEEELRNSEARYRALVDAIPDAILRFNGEGVCVDARLGVLEGILEPRGRVLDAPIDDLFAPELASALRDAISRSGVAGPVTFEHQSDRASSSKYYEVCVSPVGGTDALVLIREVTATRRMREWMFRNERLASVGSLATGVAHEINNPLTAVVVNASFVRDVVSGCRTEAEALSSADVGAGRRISKRLGEADEALRDLEQGAERVAEVVRELKAFASPADDAAASVDLESVLDASLRLVHNQIRHRARAVRAFAGVPAVWGNAAKLEDVFVNLLVNASQAIASGAADRNEIRVSSDVTDDGRVVVTVEDTGSGIPPDALERIFDPFYTTKPVGTGTGMGLAVCQAIVSSYGGEITVSSELGRGSRFRVWLLRTSDVPVARPTLRVAIPATRRGRIAIIDDEPMAARALQRVIGGEHDVFVAQTAQAALDLIQGGTRFDLILCDVMMPVISGVEFHSRLRRIQPDQAVKVVFLTGGVFAPETLSYLESVENPVLEKPGRARQVRELVAEYLSKRPVSRPSLGDDA